MPTLKEIQTMIVNLGKEKNWGEDVATKIYYAMIELGEAGDLWKHRGDIEYLCKLLGLKDLNLEIASEYLLMATWLAYLKSKLLLPGTPEEEFKVQEVAEKLKLQLKKLELIRLLSEQMLKRKRLGREIRTRGMKGNIRSIYSTEYNLSLFAININKIYIMIGN